MARISPIGIQMQPRHYMVSVRKTIDFMKEYGDFMGEALKSTAEIMEREGCLPADGPVVCFHGTDLEQLDVEAGFTCAVSVVEAGQVSVREIPPRKVLTAIDQGPYEEQDPTLLELYSYAGELGYELTDEVYYCYLNDTERPESEYLTKMVLPIGN